MPFIIIIAIAIVVSLALLFFCSPKEIIEEGNNYRILENSQSEYFCEVIDNSGKIFAKEKVSSLPKFKKMNDNILEMNFGSGNAVYCQYFDVENKLISEVFGASSAVGYGKIAYMDFLNNQLVLIVQNIFDKNVFYKEFHFDFPPIAVPANAVLNAKFLNENTLQITYLKGDDYEETTENIKL